MQRSILLDSDILIDHLRKNINALDFMSAEIDAGSLLFISVISRTEILAGIRQGEDKTIESLFNLLTSVDIDQQIADKAGSYLRQHAKSHSVGIGDAIIAATCHEMRLTLVTRNIKHYPMKDIKILKPY